MSTALEARTDQLRTLEQYGLVSPSDLSAAKAARGHDLLADLVEKRLLTRFQADAVRNHTADQLVLSHFHLLDVLGSGAMGVVYKARSSKDSNLYAIKAVPRKNVVNLKAVVEKVEALKQLRHPRVSALVAIGAQGDRVYMAWPLLEGGVKLDEVVQKQGRLAPKQAAQVAQQVASGLQAYHQHDLFHGLLKPSDVLIGSDRRVRILDFGVGFLLTCERGKAVLSTMTNGKALAKGLDCASPESIVDPLQRTTRGDQYSLGCILYYGLTGQFPFPDKNPVKKMLGHQFEQPTPLKELAPETPPRLEVIVNRLMSKDPKDRFASTDELVEQLQAFTSDSRVAPVASPSATPAPKKTLSPSALVGKAKPEVAPKSEAAPKRAGVRMPWWLGVAIGVVAGAGAAVLTWFLRG